MYNYWLEEKQGYNLITKTQTMDYSILFNDPLFQDTLKHIENKDFLEPPKQKAVGEIMLFEMNDLQKGIYTALRHQQKEVQDDFDAMFFGPDNTLAQLGREYITKCSEFQVLEILMWYLIRRQAKELQPADHEFTLGLRAGFEVIIISNPVLN